MIPFIIFCVVSVVAVLGYRGAKLTNKAIMIDVFGPVASDDDVKRFTGLLGEVRFRRNQIIKGSGRWYFAKRNSKDFSYSFCNMDNECENRLIHKKSPICKKLGWIFDGNFPTEAKWGFCDKKTGEINQTLTFDTRSKARANKIRTDKIVRVFVLSNKYVVEENAFYDELVS